MYIPIIWFCIVALFTRIGVALTPGEYQWLVGWFGGVIAALFVNDIKRVFHKARGLYDNYSRKERDRG